MKTNRDQILQDAFILFMQMNYEKASFAKLQEATGLTSAGITHHFGNKLNLFIAVVDKYFLDAQTYSYKFDLQCSTLQEFIDTYIKGIEDTVDRLKDLSQQKSVQEGSRNYYQFLNQACLYYPGFEDKCYSVFQKQYELWKTIIQRAREAGEIRNDVVVEEAANMFHLSYFGLSFEMSFSVGLSPQYLKRHFQYVYNLIKV